MYLSQILLDLRHPSVRQALRDCNDMHRNLMQGFPGYQAGGAASDGGYGVLYRLEERHDGVRLLMASREKPERAALTARGFNLSSDSPKDISGLRQVFTEGTAWRFELLASPCRKKGCEGKNSRRVFLRTEQERRDWLARKAEQGGFELLEALEYGDRVVIEGAKGDMTIHHEAVRFIGVLRITDPERFWRTYCDGIGPGKAYGLGMLTVART